MKKMSLILFIVFISNVFLAQEGENRQTISMINSSKVGEVIFSHSSFRTLYHDIEQTNLFSYFKEDLNGFQVSINQFNETKEIPLSLILLKNNENQTHIGVSLFKEVVYSNQIDFILDNSLIINNTELSEIQIDFDNGEGYQLISLDDKIMSVTYKELGQKKIKFKIELNQTEYIRSYHLYVAFNQNQVNRSSIRYPHHTITITGQNDVISNCDGNLGVTHAKVHILYRDSINKKFHNPVIFVEGLDMNRNSVVDATYGDTIRYGNFGWDSFVTGYASSLEDITLLPSAIDTLLNAGFDVILLDFSFGGDYIQKNSEVLIQLIKQLNDSINQGDECEKINVIAASMGGIIARHALTKMESQNLNHNVKTYISFDAPHQGGNLPLNIQCFTHFVGLRGGNQGALDGWLSMQYPAPVQLLPYHMAYYPDTINCLNRELYDELALLGYPQNTNRNVAITNGSGNGIGLPFGSGDLMLDVDFDPALINATFITKGYATSGGTSNVIGKSKYFYGKYDDEPLNLFDTDLEDTYLFPDTIPYIDFAPGGITTIMKTDIIPEIVDAVGASYINHYEPGNSFISVLSGFDLNLPSDSLFFNVSNHQSLLTSLSPFDGFYFPDSNEYHIQLTPGNIQFIKNELLIPYPSPQVEITNTQLQADIFNAYQFTSMISDSNNVLWDFGNGDTSSQINPTYQYSSVGNYQVILKAVINGCDYYDTVQLKVIDFTNIEESIKNTLKIYPNPTEEKLYIKSNKSIEKVLIYDFTGKIVDIVTVKKREIILNLYSYNAGVYYIQVENDGMILTEKVILTK